MPQNFYELVWIFIIYAFLGWCTEVAYAALDTGKFVNRGFLNGPYCPIYGCGIVIVVAVLTPLRGNLLILFAGSMILTTALEYLTGFLLEKIFHDKWWDYSDKPFQIKGYVCLKFSVYWGLACTFVMKLIHPLIYGMVIRIPYVAGMIILGLLMCMFFTDCCFTVTTVLQFNRHLKLMTHLADSIHHLSDEIGENIYENVTGVIEKSEEFQETHPELLSRLSGTKDSILEFPENAKNRIADVLEEKKKGYRETIEEKKRQRAELLEKYEKMFEEKNTGFRRLINAFPDMISREYNDALQKFRDHFNMKIK